MELSFNEDRIFVTKRPAAEKALSDSIVVGGMVISASYKVIGAFSCCFINIHFFGDVLDII